MTNQRKRTKTNENTTIQRRKTMKNEEQKQMVTIEEEQIATQEVSTSIEIRPYLLIRTFDMTKKLPVVTEKFIVLVIVGGKNPVSALVELQQKDLLDSRSLTLKIGEQIVGVNISLKKKEIENLQKQLREESMCKIQYANAGHLPNCYVYGNGYFYYPTNSFYFSPKYIQEKDYDCAENSLVDMNSACIPMLYASNKTAFEIFSSAMTQFVRIYNKFDILISTGAALAISMRDKFTRVACGTPSIFIFGSPQSGKSTIKDFISAIYGLPDVLSHASGDSTDKGIGRIIHSFHQIPVFVDDFHRAILDESVPMVKNIFEGISRVLAENGSFIRIEVHTSIVATANEFWTKPTEQLLSRVLFATVKENEFDLSKFEYFFPEQRKELSQILPILLQYRDWIPEIYPKVYAELCKLTNQTGKRHVFSLAISCTMWVIVNHIVGKELVNWRQIAIEYNSMYLSLLNSEVKNSDVILNDITRLVETEKLENGTDWKLMKDNILRLNLNRYLEKYNAANPKTMMKASQFRLLVANDRRFDTHSISMKGLNRAISIDVSENEYLLEMLRRQQKMWVTSFGKSADDEE